MNRLFVLLLLAGAFASIPAVIGAGHLVPTPHDARADACSDDGSYPNCATQCAVTGSDCDASSDGDVDWGWVCSATGNDCPSTGNDSGGDTGSGGDSGGDPAANPDPSPDTGDPATESDDWTGEWSEGDTFSTSEGDNAYGLIHLSSPAHCLLLAGKPHLSSLRNKEDWASGDAQTKCDYPVYAVNAAAHLFRSDGAGLLSVGDNDYAPTSWGFETARSPQAHTKQHGCDSGEAYWNEGFGTSVELTSSGSYRSFYGSGIYSLKGTDLC